MIYLTLYLNLRLQSPYGKVWGTFAPYAALIIILGVINFYLFVLPMAMRM